MEQQKEMNLFDLCAALVRGVWSGLRWLVGDAAEGEID